MPLEDVEVRLGDFFQGHAMLPSVDVDSNLVALDTEERPDEIAAVSDFLESPNRDSFAGELLEVLLPRERTIDAGRADLQLVATGHHIGDVESRIQLLRRAHAVFDADGLAVQAVDVEAEDLPLDFDRDEVVPEPREHRLADLFQTQYDAILGSRHGTETPSRYRVGLEAPPRFPRPGSGEKKAGSRPTFQDPLRDPRKM